MKKIISVCLMLWAGLSLQAQKIYTEPATGEFTASDSVTIFVDIKQCDCQALLGSAEPLYIWTWLPFEHPQGHPLHNGSWTQSNTALEMKNEGNDVWSFKMVPTEFYEVEEGEVYEKNIHMLVKALDGGSGGGCDENKTEDLELKIDPPVTEREKVYSFPAKSQDTVRISQDDVFTFFYDKTMETKESLLDATEFFVYARGQLDGQTVFVSRLRDVISNPDLQMQDAGNGMFKLSFIPSKLYNVPEGSSLTQLQLQIIKRPEMNLSSDDLVDGTFFYELKCD
ncbi:MAG: hypothetical protein AAGI38_03590 [Bacteroidota bacterium]